MKAAFTTGMLAASASALNIVAGEEFNVIDRYQVNNRTLLNQWELFMKYEVDAKSDRDPSENFLTVTTILKNNDVTGDMKRRIGEGEIFQTYFSMKDPEKEEKMPIKLPAPTADLENTITEKTVDVPFYENFVCSLQYNA